MGYESMESKNKEFIKCCVCCKDIQNRDKNHHLALRHYYYKNEISKICKKSLEAEKVAEQNKETIDEDDVDALLIDSDDEEDTSSIENTDEKNKKGEEEGNEALLIDSDDGEDNSAETADEKSGIGEEQGNKND